MSQTKKKIPSPANTPSTGFPPAQMYEHNRLGIRPYVRYAKIAAGSLGHSMSLAVPMKPNVMVSQILAKIHAPAYKPIMMTTDNPSPHSTQSGTLNENVEVPADSAKRFIVSPSPRFPRDYNTIK